jgi:voltage-gated potassium channel
MKSRLFKIIEKADEGDVCSKVFDYIIMILIMINVIAIILESYESLSQSYGSVFRVIEIISVVIFSIEYLLRLWTSDLKYPSDRKVRARVKHTVSFMAMVDLLAILPFYLPMLIPIDLRFLRMLRLFRVARVFKLNRYSKALNTISNVINEKKEELITTVFIMLFIIVISSTLIYYIEYDYQPEAFPNIIASCWWAVATLTTVGYGDIYPITGLGKVLAAIIALAGIGLVALPTGIISAGFMEQINNKKRCPHCGKEVN